MQFIRFLKFSVFLTFDLTLRKNQGNAVLKEKGGRSTVSAFNLVSCVLRADTALCRTAISVVF